MNKDMYKGLKAYPQEGSPTTPYSGMLKEYDLHFGEVRKERNAWRKIAFALLVMAALSNLGWIYAASLPKAIPHVIEIAPWGESKYVGPIGESGQINIPEKAKIYSIRRVVEQIRSIPLDQNVLLKNLDEAYQYLSAKSAAVVTQEIEKDNVFKLFGTIRREITIESIIHVTGSAWQADWIETDYDLVDAAVRGRKRMRAIITIVQGKPGESVKTSNPLGIYFDSYQRQILEE